MFVHASVNMTSTFCACLYHPNLQVHRYNAFKSHNLFPPVADKLQKDSDKRQRDIDKVQRDSEREGSPYNTSMSGSSLNKGLFLYLSHIRVHAFRMF